MTPPIDIRADHLRIVQDVLYRHLPAGVKVWVFGSRASWATKDSSDLDLALDGETEIPRTTLSAVEAAFEESDLPFAVDIVDVNRIGEGFLRIVEQQRVRFPESATGWGSSSQLDRPPPGWECSTLGAVCERGGGNIQTGPFGSQLHASDYRPVGIPSIMPQNLGDNRVIEDRIARIGKRDARRLARYLVREGDIVYSRRGDVERRALIGPREDGWLCGTGCLRVRLGENGVDPRYASYYLGHPAVREWIVRHAHGATMPNLNTAILSACPFIVPPVSEQRAIAHILVTLDDKIELNRRMNATLEAMARALFRSWFVDFDPVRAKMEGRDTGLPKDLADLFPDRLVKSDLGEIPEGWEVATVGDHIVNFDAKRIPVSGAVRAERRGPYPYHGAAGVLDHVDDYIFDGVFLLLGEDGSVMRENGLAVTQYVWGKFWVNNHAHVLQGAGPVSTEQAYLHFSFEPVAPLVTGAVQPKLSQRRMNRVPFVFAGEGICRAFTRVVQPWFARLRSCAEETKILAAIRDALLPKLVSGELRVNAAEPVFAHDDRPASVGANGA